MISPVSTVQTQHNAEFPHCPSAETASARARTIMKTIQLSSNNSAMGLLNPLSAGGGGNATASIPPSSSSSFPLDHHASSVENNWVIKQQQQQLSQNESSHQKTQSSTMRLTRSRTAHSLGASSAASTASSSQGSSICLLQKEESQADSTITGTTESSSSSCSSSFCAPHPSPDFTTFGMDLRRYTGESPNAPVFDSGMRKVLEPHLRKARIAREEARKYRPHRSIRSEPNVASIASSVGVPYVRLRSERPFLYDTYTHPMHQILAETLGVDDLSQLHHHHYQERRGEVASNNSHSNLEQHILAPLKCRESRLPFQESYDNFVTSFCIPLLHSMAMSHNHFHSIHNGSENTRISYRYQAFPDISVVRPGDASPGPRCNTAQGHNVAFLHFHVPLTPSYGTNAVYTESHPGKEDWHPLQTKSTGLGFLVDGARCIHFNMENTTDSTLVALDFGVAIYFADGASVPMVDPDGLCNEAALEDAFSLAGPGYYEEAVIDIRLGSPLWQCVANKRDGKHKLLDPDSRNGYPFA